ncbi:MAG TPA: ATP-binding protein [Thermoanaerobaculia bacterium]|nr:ATP-binding protein [Thermoanaerobaculia bacterium]
MSWITIAWSMVASACLTVAALHLYLGLRRRSRSDLLFAAATVCAAAIGYLEMALMTSPSPERHAVLIRVVQLPFAMLILMLVLFVRSYLGAGRIWLGASAVAVRFLLLAVDLVVSPNVNYLRIDRVLAVPMPWGEAVHLAQGELRPWTRLGQLSSLIFVLFALDAIRTAWRRGDRHRAVVVGGSIAFAIGLGATHSALLMQGTIRSPSLISVAYLAIVAAMSYQLTSDSLRSSQLSRQLDASEAALGESERRMALAAEAADVGVWLYDIARDEIWINEIIRGRRGWTEERVPLARFLAGVHPEDRDGLRAALEDATRTAGRFEREYRLARADGGSRWVSSRGRAEALEGRGVVLRGAALDVTRRKEAELEAARRRDELAHLSRVTLLGELSGSLAHELNQPLTAILSNAQAAQRFLEEGAGRIPDVRAILADIVAEDRHAGEVIRRHRLLLRKGEVRLEPLDMSETVGEVLSLVRSDLLRSGVVATAELPAGLPAALGDRVQIQQVILNLITNACDAVGSAGPADRRIAVRAAADDGAGVRVSVSDRGTGIPAEAADRLFEPFFTTKPDGMGLGLAVCRSIISAHGGRLWASANPDRGATFCFTLPTIETAP